MAIAGAAALGLTGYSILGESQPTLDQTTQKYTSLSATISSPTARTPATIAKTAQSNIKVSKRIDVHGHIPYPLPSSFTADRVISLMDHAGISQMVLMPMGLMQGADGAYHNLDQLTLSIYKQYPDRILPFVSTMYQAWHNQDESRLSYAEMQLKTGKFKGLGECILRYPAEGPPRNEPEVNVPADSPFWKKVSDLAVEYDVVMSVHMEPEPDSIASLERLLDYNKELKLIWAHMGSCRGIPRYVRAIAHIGVFMDRHPNLYTDFSGMQPRNLAPTGGTRLPSITDNNGNLLPEFKKIFQDHNDRVLFFGLDTPYPENWAEYPFAVWTEWADNVVAQLEDRDVAERIMHKNAEELFKISS